MAFYEGSVGHYFHADYTWNRNTGEYKIKSMRWASTFKPRDDATYCAVFSIGQQKELKLALELLEKDGMKLLYKGPQAVNRRRGHGTMPRNTLIIFERA